MLSYYDRLNGGVGCHMLDDALQIGGHVVERIPYPERVAAHFQQFGQVDHCACGGFCSSHLRWQSEIAPDDIAERFATVAFLNAFPLAQDVGIVVVVRLEGDDLVLTAFVFALRHNNCPPHGGFTGLPEWFSR